MTRHKRSRYMPIALIGMLLLVLVPAPASAAAPANNDFNSATVISGLPFTASLSTREATAASDDPSCQGRGHSVWFRTTPSKDMRIVADTLGSNYDTTLSVYTGARGSLTRVACNDDTADLLQSFVSFNAKAGVTYHFMVASCCGEPGGNLVFHVNRGLEVAASLNAAGSFDPGTGVATIGGTITCSRTASARVTGQMRQDVGRLVTIRGGVSGRSGCGTTPTTWKATVTLESGKFAGGQAEVSVVARACSRLECRSVRLAATVKLSGGGR